MNESEERVTEIHIPTGQAGYHEVLAHVLRSGRPRTARGRKTYDAGQVTVVIDDPRNTLPLSTGRGISRRVAAAEAVQLIGGFSQPKLLPPQFDRYKEADGSFHGSYGIRIGTQLAHVVRKLREDGGTRQAVVTLWDAILDNQPGKKDYPCTVALGFQICEWGHLELNVLMRSNDVYLGSPYDWFQFTQLQLSVARLLGVHVGKYRHTAWSLHVYEEDVEAAENVVPPIKTADNPPQGIGIDGETNVYDVMARARAIGGTAWKSLNLTDSERWYVDVLGLEDPARKLG